MLFVDWDTALRFWGKLIPAPGNAPRQVLEFVREGQREDGFIVDPRRTGSIAILEASGEEIISLQNAGYRLSVD